MAAKTRTKVNPFMDREGGAQGAPQGPGLTPEQLKAKLSLYNGTLPSVVIDDLFTTLKSMSLPEAKVDEIIERTIRSYAQDSGSRIDELVEKMNDLEETLIRTLNKIGESRVEQESSGLKYEADERLRTSSVQDVPASPPPQTVFDESDEPAEPSPALRGRAGPLLEDTPTDAMRNAIMLKWVEFLLETVGHQNLPDVLDYYVDIGWISEKVTMKMLAYANGMVAPRGRAKEKLSTRDHLRSLLFIEKLRGHDLDHTKIARLEREIEYAIEKRLRH